MLVVKNAFLLFLLLVAPALAQGKPVSLDYTDADLVPVLRRLARDAGLNIFISPEVKGRVTAKIKNVSPTDALDLILSMQEQPYRYKLLNRTIVVASPERLQKIPDDIFGKVGAAPGHR